MIYKKFVLVILGVLCVLRGNGVQGRPAHRDGSPHQVGAACLDYDCDFDSGPVCGIDASGFPRTFETRCLAELAYCREGRYYVAIKEGEC